ncbi:hypothetical protein TRIUR3_16090 [Triticum urartu]|uniref:Uncharacterized protein n=1 Tax=Triticum urartu TaxID=4572 RepID=M7ZZL7_TRIUA|nr:hypothetical protein TRIUR3_16090 [Triticum urartu]
MAKTRRQAPHHGGGVTVVSCGEGEGGVKIAVSRDELECIAAGVSRRQCRHRHVVVPSAPGPPVEEEQSARAGVGTTKPNTIIIPILAKDFTRWPRTGTAISPLYAQPQDASLSKEEEEEDNALLL